MCPFKLQTLSLTDEEKGGLDQAREGNTRGPPRLTSTNWLATPTCLILLRFSHQCPPSTATQSQKEYQSIGKNDGELFQPPPPKKAHEHGWFSIPFCGCLLLANSYCSLDQLLRVVSQKYDPIIYLEAHTYIHSHSAPECIIQQTLPWFFFSSAQCMTYGNMCTRGKFKIGRNLLKSKSFICLFCLPLMM